MRQNRLCWIHNSINTVGFTIDPRIVKIIFQSLLLVLSTAVYVIFKKTRTC